ncbi:MAG: 3-methyl-2-oxobutanoate hydroxymethyltransferase, partial [Verrucomicrobiales bacterium]|nr:3-methyl-2-oxobutanoate hydroxymethyltransferase [Verrucomicrobiales bacterium]
QSFLSAATPHGLASREEAIRVAFRALEAGASSVYCSASPWIIEGMALEGIPVVGHLGLVPRHATWTGWRAIGRTAAEAVGLHRRMKELESAGAYAAELEVVPHQLAPLLSSRTGMLLMSLGSGAGCDTQFLSQTTSSATIPGARRATPTPNAISPPNTTGSNGGAWPPSRNTLPTSPKTAFRNPASWWRWTRQFSWRWSGRLMRGFEKLRHGGAGGGQNPIGRLCALTRRAGPRRSSAMRCCFWSG